MTHSNCLFWALLQCLLYGGTIRKVSIRGTRIPRFLWVQFGRQYFWRPKGPKTGWRAWIDKVWYEGEVVEANRRGVPVRRVTEGAIPYAPVLEHIEVKAVKGVRHRSAITGKFITAAQAAREKDTSVAERR